MTLYQWDTEDPLLKAWMKAFPDSVTPKDEISDDLLAHLRYPEDMFKVQREVLARYHVTDTATFYRGSENWEVPEDPTQENLNRNQPPFYLTVQLPETRSGVLADQRLHAAEPAEHGQLHGGQRRRDVGRLRPVPNTRAAQRYGGPRSGAGGERACRTTRRWPQAILSYKNTSKVEYGNLLTLPLGDEVVYVQPVYTYSGGTGSYPILQFVLVSVGGADGESADQVGIGTSFDEAVANALGLGCGGCPGARRAPAARW